MQQSNFFPPRFDQQFQAKQPAVNDLHCSYCLPIGDLERVPATQTEDSSLIPSKVEQKPEVFTASLIDDKR